MRPAFTSTRSAAAFALLLLLVLLSPVLAEKKFLPPRDQAYATLGWGMGPYPWIRHEIFEETNDIDIAFIGSSHLLNGIDTPYVQAALSRQLGRPAVVRTIGWGGAGYNILYLIAQDLLAHRPVRMLVFYDENVKSNPKGGVSGSAIASLFRWGDNAACLQDLPLTTQGIYYFASLVGMPKNMLGAIRPNIPDGLFPDAPDYFEPRDKMFIGAPGRLGAVSAQLGFNSSRLFADYTAFIPYRPPATQAVGVSIYSTAHPAPDFEFTHAPLPPLEDAFARQFAQVAEQHGCQLVMLHLPTLLPALDDPQSPILRERADWPAVFSTNLVLAGIPESKLFAGLTDAEIKKLYLDIFHFNRNGQEYFTPLITPALIDIYDASVIH